MELKSKGLSFGEATNLTKYGYMVSREGWNGKGMFLFYIDGHPFTHNAVGETEMLPFLAMKTVTGQCIPWLASQADVLASDWCISGHCKEDE